MFPPEILDKIIQFLDLKSLVNLSMMNRELQMITKRNIVKMKNIVSVYYLNFQKCKYDYEDEDTWNLHKIIITMDDENNLMVKNLHSWSTEIFVNYDILLGEYQLPPDSDFISLPPDGYLRFEKHEDIVIFYSLTM